MGGIFVYFIKDLPRPERFSESAISQSTKIYDRTGQILLYEISGKEKRTLVSLSQIPEFLIKAVLAAEDKSFFEHQGLDFRAIVRAVLYDLKLKKPIQGGSTITQQLIRSYFLTRKKTLKRKTREIILALELERKYSKEQILEWYLNLIPFGGNIYGVEEAAKAFFGKHIWEINPPQATILASLIKAPSRLSPYGPNREELLKRKDYILERMVQLGYLSFQEAEKIKKEKIEFQPKTTSFLAPHFVIFVKNYLEKKYGRNFLETKGFKVLTTLDFELQQIAQELLKEGIKEIEGYNAHNGALLAINPKTGEVLVMVGSRDYFAKSFPRGCSPGINCKFDPQVNTVLSLRQPGSALKPFVYALAFQKGLTPQTIVWDVKTEFNPLCSPQANQKFASDRSLCYHPQNYDEKFLGPISLKSALAQSRNLPAVKILYLTGVREVLETLPNFGITTLKDKQRYGLSLVLGGGEVRLLELVEGFGVFANEGIRVPLNFILKIEDSKGSIVEKLNITKTRVLSSQIAKEINDILSDNKARAPMFGYHSPLNLPGFQVAAKTGTTQNFRDAWVIGYTPSLVVGIWIGNNDNSPMIKKPAVMLAGPIWKRFIKKALEKFEKKEFTPPQKRTGKIPILNGILPKNHSLLYYLNPQDNQLFFWEQGIKNWLSSHFFY